MRTLRCKNNGRWCDVFEHDGWYVESGGCLINWSLDPIEDGVDINELDDLDTITWNEPILSEHDMWRALE